MLRSSLYAMGTVLLGASALAQADLGSRLKPITAPVKDAGIYSVATGEWTRAKTPSATIGTEIIYDNTCNTGFYGGQSPGEIFTDEGRVPSETSPNNLQSKPGCISTGCPMGYTVNGFQIGYCTDTVAPENVNMTFFCQYNACDDPTIWATQIVAGFAIGGLPSTTVAGSLACWIVTLDLESPPQTADLSFSLGADADGAFGTTDTFGWSFEQPNTIGNSGPVIAGDPTSCTSWGNTIWDPTQPSPETQGTGMGSQNLFRLDGGTAANPGCYFFGAAGPFSSFHLQLFSTNACTPTGDPGITQTCFGTAQSCPCGATDQAGTDGLGGCDNSFLTGGATLDITTSGGGQPSVSGDVSGGQQVVTTSTRGPTNPAPGLLFQGTLLNNPVPAFGDGLRCPGGQIIRCGVQTYGSGGTAGELTYQDDGYGPSLNQPLATQGQIPSTGGTRYYQEWYRNNAPFCTSAVFNLSNAVEVIWLP